MYARSSTLRHPSGLTLKTPLLVPSFSSRGFRFDSRGKSEIDKIYKNTAEILVESMLVSAYDIHYGHLPKPNRFRFSPALTIVDSGGYETGADHDFSSIYNFTHKTKKWNINLLGKIYKSWPDRIPAVFVNFDKGTAGKSVSTQIKDAKSLFRNHPRHLHNFLLKPTRKCKGLLSKTVKIALSTIKEFGTFHIIGMTEKELGRSMLDRMETIARLRLSLDEARIISPIQIFGALDPLSACLYSVSGAEIFDGLTWLRFAYSEGKCVYSHNQGVMGASIDMHDDFVQFKILSDNYNEWRRLQLNLRDFVTTKDYSKLGPHADIVKKA